MIYKHLLAAGLGAAAYLLLAASPLAAFQGLNVLLLEGLRGALALTLSPLAGLGMALAEAYYALACTPWQDLLVGFPFVLGYHLLLGVLWGRYRLNGGIAALLLAGLWQAGRSYPDLGSLPMLAFGLTAALLLLHQAWPRPVRLEEAR